MFGQDPHAEVVAAARNGLVWRFAVLLCTQLQCQVSLHCCTLKELSICGVSAGSECAVPDAPTAAVHR